MRAGEFSVVGILRFPYSPRLRFPLFLRNTRPLPKGSCCPPPPSLQGRTTGYSPGGQTQPGEWGCPPGTWHSPRCTCWVGSGKHRDQRLLTTCFAGSPWRIWQRVPAAVLSSVRNLGAKCQSFLNCFLGVDSLLNYSRPSVVMGIYIPDPMSFFLHPHKWDYVLCNRSIVLPWWPINSVNNPPAQTRHSSWCSRREGWGR